MWILCVGKGGWWANGTTHITFLPYSHHFRSVPPANHRRVDKDQSANQQVRKRLIKKLLNFQANQQPKYTILTVRQHLLTDGLLPVRQAIKEQLRTIVILVKCIVVFLPQLIQLVDGASPTLLLLNRTAVKTMSKIIDVHTMLQNPHMLTIKDAPMLCIQGFTENGSYIHTSNIEWQHARIYQPISLGEKKKISKLEIAT